MANYTLKAYLKVEHNLNDVKRAIIDTANTTKKLAEKGQTNKSSVADAIGLSDKFVRELEQKVARVEQLRLRALGQGTAMGNSRALRLEKYEVGLKGVINQVLRDSNQLIQIANKSEVDISRMLDKTLKTTQVKFQRNSVLMGQELAKQGRALNSSFSAMLTNGFKLNEKDLKGFDDLQKSVKAKAAALQGTLTKVQKGSITRSQDEVKEMKRTLDELRQLQTQFGNWKLGYMRRQNQLEEREMKQSVLGGAKSRGFERLLGTVSNYEDLSYVRGNLKTTSDVIRAQRRLRATKRFMPGKDELILMMGEEGASDFYESTMRAEHTLAQRAKLLGQLPRMNMAQGYVARLQGKIDDGSELSGIERMMGRGLSALGIGWSPYGRAFNTGVNKLNQRITNVSQLFGTSLYGLGAVGLGGALIGGSVGAASEKYNTQAVLAGLVNTYARFTNVNGTPVSAGKNFDLSLQYTDNLYSKLRAQARISPLTTQEMLQYYMAGAPAAMKAKISPTQAIGVVDKFASIGRMMGLMPRDVEQDIRATMMGDIRASNKIGTILGFTKPELGKATQEGPDSLLKLIDAKFAGLEPALARYATSFAAKFSTFIDALQQAGIKLGEVIIPKILPVIEKFTQMVEKARDSKEFDKLATNVGGMLEGLGEAFVAFVNTMGPIVNNVGSILMFGIAGAITKFVAQMVIQQALMASPLLGIVGGIATLVAGIIYWNNQVKKQNVSTLKSQVDLYEKGDVSDMTPEARMKMEAQQYRLLAKQGSVKAARDYIRMTETTRQQRAATNRALIGAYDNPAANIYAPWLEDRSKWTGRTGNAEADAIIASAARNSGLGGIDASNIIEQWLNDDAQKWKAARQGADNPTMLAQKLKQFEASGRKDYVNFFKEQAANLDWQGTQVATDPGMMTGAGGAGSGSPAMMNLNIPKLQMMSSFYGSQLSVLPNSMQKLGFVSKKFGVDASLAKEQYKYALAQIDAQGGEADPSARKAAYFEYMQKMQELTAAMDEQVRTIKDAVATQKQQIEELKNNIASQKIKNQVDQLEYQRSKIDRTTPQGAAQYASMGEQIYRLRQVGLRTDYASKYGAIALAKQQAMNLGIESYGARGSAGIVPGIGATGGQWQDQVRSVLSQFGLKVTSGLRPGAITSTGRHSLHGTGTSAYPGALDIGGTSLNMGKFFQYAKETYGDSIKELIYSPLGAWYGGKFVKPSQMAARDKARGSSIYKDHFNHVHLALNGGAADIIGSPGKLQRMADQFGISQSDLRRALLDQEKSGALFDLFRNQEQDRIEQESFKYNRATDLYNSSLDRLREKHAVERVGVSGSALTSLRIKQQAELIRAAGEEKSKRLIEQLDASVARGGISSAMAIPMRALYTQHTNVANMEAANWEKRGGLIPDMLSAYGASGKFDRKLGMIGLSGYELTNAKVLDQLETRRASEGKRFDRENNYLQMLSLFDPESAVEGLQRNIDMHEKELETIKKLEIAQSRRVQMLQDEGAISNMITGRTLTQSQQAFSETQQALQRGRPLNALERLDKRTSTFVDAQSFQIDKEISQLQAMDKMMGITRSPGYYTDLANKRKASVYNSASKMYSAGYRSSLNETTRATAFSNLGSLIATNPTNLNFSSVSGALSPFSEMFNNNIGGAFNQIFGKQLSPGISSLKEQRMQGIATLGGSMAGNVIGVALGGDPGAVSAGTSIGGGIAAAFGANPYIAAGAAILGGVLGGLFNKKKKQPDPAEEQHKKNLEKLLSSIDKSLRPAPDFFRTVRGDVLYGSASRWYSGRGYASLGLQGASGRR